MIPTDDANMWRHGIALWATMAWKRSRKLKQIASSPEDIEIQFEYNQASMSYLISICGKTTGYGFFTSVPLWQLLGGREDAAKAISDRLGKLIDGPGKCGVCGIEARMMGDVCELCSREVAWA